MVYFWPNFSDFSTNFERQLDWRMLTKRVLSDYYTDVFQEKILGLDTLKEYQVRVI